MAVDRTYPEGWSTTASCDRCGATETVDHSDGPEAIREFDTRWTRVTVASGGLRFLLNEQHDLCDKCVAGLARWLSRQETPDA